jgi:flavin-dependent dehydrogenase
MMRSARAAPVDWWNAALATTIRTRLLIQGPASSAAPTRVVPAFPSLASTAFGDGWIAVGDAAIALDPVGGQGVAFALDTACRAFEAARVDPSFTALGPIYQDAIRDRFDRHLVDRASVYAEAASVLPDSFLQTAPVP